MDGHSNTKAIMAVCGQMWLGDLEMFCRRRGLAGGATRRLASASWWLLESFQPMQAELAAMLKASRRCCANGALEQDEWDMRRRHATSTSGRQRPGPESGNRRFAQGLHVGCLPPQWAQQRGATAVRHDEMLQ